jgi:hypothetical protein
MLTTEDKIRGGQRGGRVAAESGQLARVARLPQAKAAQRRVGREAAKNGQLLRGLHSRWHLARGVINPQCEYCIGSE